MNNENKMGASGNSAFNTPEPKKRKSGQYDEQDDKRMKIQQNKSAMEELAKAMKSEKVNLDTLLNQVGVITKQCQDTSLDIELVESEISVLEKKFAMNVSQMKLIGGLKDNLQMLEKKDKCLKLKLAQLTEYKGVFNT